MGSTLAQPPLLHNPYDGLRARGMVVHDVEHPSHRGAARGMEAFLGFKRRRRKWKEFHRNGGSLVWYRLILAAGVPEGMICKLQ